MNITKEYKTTVNHEIRPCVDGDIELDTPTSGGEEFDIEVDHTVDELPFVITQAYGDCILCKPLSRQTLVEIKKHLQLVSVR